MKRRAVQLGDTPSAMLTSEVMESVTAAAPLAWNGFGLAAGVRRSACQFDCKGSRRIGCTHR